MDDGQPDRGSNFNATTQVYFSSAVSVDEVFFIHVHSAVRFRSHHFHVIDRECINSYDNNGMQHDDIPT